MHICSVCDWYAWDYLQDCVDEFHFQALPSKMCVSIFDDILIYSKSWEDHV
jgi:hypothetical protein